MSSNLFCVDLDFADRGHNLLHIDFVSQQGKLRNPNCFPSSALGVGKRLSKEGVLGCRLRSAQPLAVFSVAKHVQIVQRRIAGLVRYAFGIHGSDKTLGRDTSELFAVHMKDVSVLPVAGAALIKLLRRDTRNLAQLAIQHAGILMTAASLLVEASKLRHENYSLPFAETV